MTRTSFAVNWSIDIQNNNRVNHELIVTIYNIEHALNRPVPKSIVFVLNEGGYNWIGTDVPNNIQLNFGSSQWGFDPATRRYEISLAELPEDLKNNPEFKIRARFLQTGCIQKIGTIAIYPLNIKCSGFAITHARVSIKIPPISRIEAILIRFLEQIRMGPEQNKQRLTLFGNAVPTVEIDQVNGEIVYEGSSIIPLGSIAFSRVSRAQILFGFILGLSTGILMNIIANIITHWISAGN